MSQNKKSFLTHADQKIWHFVTRNITPIDPSESTDKKVAETDSFEEMLSGKNTVTTPRYPLPEKARADHREHITDILPTETKFNAAIDKKTDSTMRRGKIEIYKTLDLHGLTQEASQDILTSFIMRHRGEARRYILVITGKGKQGEGVLKRAVPTWLNSPALQPYILSFRHAAPHHGGSGALYVLLRRKR
ncbi:MAG: Smr/MutS family protein [Alphaproteobacteria bacterium]